jgi:hypothetical protein
MAEAQTILDEAESTLFEQYRDETPTPLVSALPSVVVDEQIDALQAPEHHPFGFGDRAVTGATTDLRDEPPLDQ